MIRQLHHRAFIDISATMGPSDDEAPHKGPIAYTAFPYDATKKWGNLEPFKSVDLSAPLTSSGVTVSLMITLPFYGKYFAENTIKVNVSLQVYCRFFDESAVSLLMYRKISNISRNKSPNLNVPRLVLQLFLPNSMKPGVKSRMKM